MTERQMSTGRGGKEKDKNNHKNKKEGDRFIGLALVTQIFRRRSTRLARWSQMEWIGLDGWPEIRPS